MTIRITAGKKATLAALLVTIVRAASTPRRTCALKKESVKQGELRSVSPRNAVEALAGQRAAGAATSASTKSGRVRLRF